MGYIKEILPKMALYRLARLGLAPPGKPINLTFSVTNVCQSRCKTCSIWRIYRENPKKREEELSLEEIKYIFKSLGHVYIFNISGGEPFLRPDIVEIIDLACRYLKPGIIHIPTNAIALKLVKKKTVEILKVINKYDCSTQLTVKPSLDHIGKKHDEIRGVHGNFEKVENLFHQLKTYQSAHPNLHVELGTIISNWNVDDMEEISRYITGKGADSYRNEIAERRSEMFNTDDDITPDVKNYEKAVTVFVHQIKANMKNRLFFQKMTNSFRLIYYDLAISTLKKRKQVIPCYAGISNAHINPYGDIWACCTLGYEKTIGNIRDYDYDFQSIWNSTQAKKVRDYIHQGNCYCPLANQAYSNILLHGPSLLKVIRNILKKSSDLN